MTTPFDDALASATRESGEPTTATAEMDRQTVRHDGQVYNLDAMWRAAGCPWGEGPRDWSEMAGPLIAGLVDYHAEADPRRGMPEEAIPSEDDLVFECNNVPDQYEGQGWEVGDLMAVQSVAWHYARYLDRTDCRI